MSAGSHRICCCKKTTPLPTGHQWEIGYMTGQVPSYGECSCVGSSSVSPDPAVGVKRVRLQVLEWCGATPSRSVDCYSDSGHCQSAWAMSSITFTRLPIYAGVNWRIRLNINYWGVVGGCTHSYRDGTAYARLGSSVYDPVTFQLTSHILLSRTQATATGCEQFAVSGTDSLTAYNHAQLTNINFQFSFAIITDATPKNLLNGPVTFRRGLSEIYADLSYTIDAV